jgi:lipoprotein-anchoring transpeptidase ErfK/SrfK
VTRTAIDEEKRHGERSERARRERMRVRRQRAIAVGALALLLVAGGAYALRPSGSGPAGDVIATAVASTTVETTTPSAPAAPAGVATESAEPSTPPAPATTPTPAVTPAPTTKPAIKPLRPAPGVKTIVVEKKAQRVTLYKANGTGVDTFRCSSGLLYPRIGKYKVYGRRKQSWSLYDNSTFFYFVMFVKSDKGNNIGFHSVPQLPNGKLVPGKLGKPVSHGCVRLEKSKAKFVYGWASDGTRVIVKK